MWSQPHTAATDLWQAGTPVPNFQDRKALARLACCTGRMRGYWGKKVVF